MTVLKQDTDVALFKPDEWRKNAHGGAADQPTYAILDEVREDTMRADRHTHHRRKPFKRVERGKAPHTTGSKGSKGKMREWDGRGGTTLEKTRVSRGLDLPSVTASHCTPCVAHSLARACARALFLAPAARNDAAARLGRHRVPPLVAPDRRLGKPSLRADALDAGTAASTAPCCAPPAPFPQWVASDWRWTPHARVCKTCCVCVCV